MKKPTRSAKWGAEKSRQKFDAPALIFMAAGCLVFSSQFNPYYAFLLFFSFLLVAFTADILFQRCANVPANETAWHELFGRFQRSVDATIYNLIGFPPNGRHAHLYKDVMQSFYQRLLENDRRALHAFRGKTDAEARVYLCRIAASIALNILKNEKKELPPYVALEEQKEDSPNRKDKFADIAGLDANYLVLRASIDACLEKIVEGKNRERNILIFKLAVYHGLSAKQIAAIPGFAEMSPRAIEVQISRIRFKVGECLEKN